MSTLYMMEKVINLLKHTEDQVQKRHFINALTCCNEIQYELIKLFNKELKR